MALPEPEPGLVVHHAYLWRREALSGREEGAKDRPCVVVVARRQEGERTWVMVAPVTHTPPGPGTRATEIPAATKQRLGLDAERSWVVLGEVNTFVWPGYDLRPVPGRPSAFAYGYLDRGTFGQVLEASQELWRQRQLRLVRRDRERDDDHDRSR